jgi:hypothetical protein
MKRNSPASAGALLPPLLSFPTPNKSRFMPVSNSKDNHKQIRRPNAAEKAKTSLLALNMDSDPHLSVTDSAYRQSPVASNKNSNRQQVALIVPIKKRVKVNLPAHNQEVEAGTSKLVYCFVLSDDPWSQKQELTRKIENL